MDMRSTAATCMSRCLSELDTVYNVLHLNDPGLQSRRDVISWSEKALSEEHTQNHEERKRHQVNVIWFGLLYMEEISKKLRTAYDSA